MWTPQAVAIGSTIASRAHSGPRDPHLKPFPSRLEESHLLLSMTGHGEGVASTAELHVATEIRSINNRFLKVQVRCSEGYGLLDPRIEELVRQQLKRGTVNLNVRLVRLVSPSDMLLNEPLLRRYVEVARKFAGGDDNRAVNVETLMGLP
ncbi:MAG: YicC/YloC family endoribonuclease, partial [Pirellulaceae bacterium]